MAFGAKRSRVVRQVLGQMFGLVMIGLAIGLAASRVMNQAIHALIFGITLSDPITLISVTVLVLVVAGIAGVIPALRASRVDPCSCPPDTRADGEPAMKNLAGAACGVIATSIGQTTAKPDSVDRNLDIECREIDVYHGATI